MVLRFGLLARLTLSRPSTSSRWATVAGCNAARINASRRLAALASISTLVSAVLPTAMVLTFGAVVRAIVSALQEGESVTSSSSLLWAAGAFGLIFVLKQLVFPLRATVADALARRLQRSVTTSSYCVLHGSASRFRTRRIIFSAHRPHIGR
jgi:hypothetical protein